MITNKKMIKDLNDVKNKINKIPSKIDYREYGSFHPETISKRYGSWNNALRECFGEIVREKPSLRPIIKCPVCGKDTKNPKYCSSSCAAKINNSLFPKHPKRKCLRCGQPSRSKTHYCQKCLYINRVEKYGEEHIISDFTSSYARHKYQQIRNHAHNVAKIHKLKPYKCPYCDYSNQLELCHIKDIKDFSKNTKLKIVNDIKNLIYLCPNHHWDLDHGFLILDRTAL